MTVVGSNGSVAGGGGGGANGGSAEANGELDYVRYFVIILKLN